VIRKKNALVAGRRRKRAGRPVEHFAPVPRLDESLGYLVRKTSHAIVARLEERLASHGISSSTWLFLRRLWDEDGMTQRELADALSLTPPTAVSAIDSLESQGLVERRLSGTDRRKRHIYLTDKARHLVETLRPHATAVNDVALANLTAAESHQLMQYLRKVLDSLLS
jgi:DNA-binding MarR family transcriptional regulator